MAKQCADSITAPTAVQRWNENKGEDMLTLEDVAKAFELYLLYGDDEGITQVVFEESGGDLHADGERKDD